jgi:hypothetical protein
VCKIKIFVLQWNLGSGWGWREENGGGSDVCSLDRECLRMLKYL